MNALTIRLTRLNSTHHRFEAIRADGSREVRELETRSFLAHDLTHYALEREAKLDCGFYGQLARGAGYDAPMQAEAMDVEAVVGPLQSALKDEIDADVFVARFHAVRESWGGATPAWLTSALIARVAERMRQLMGQWRATPFGQTMELLFSLGA